MSASIYRRLTGKRRRLIFFSQLLLGPDHLLLVQSSRFEERYQRFFYKDIQALVVTGLPARTWMQASLAILAGTIIMLSLTAIRVPAWRFLAIMVGIVPGIIALTDYLRGERCSMIVKTLVSNEPLPPVSRMNIARLVISRLKPAIEQAQLGEWTPEMATATGPPVMAPRPIALAPADRLIPAVLALVSVDAALYLAARLSHRNEILFVLIYSVFTEIVLAITAVRRRGEDSRWVLYALCGVIAVCATIDIFGGLGLVGFFFFITSEDQRSGSTNASRILQLPYPQFMMMWGLVWRLLAAATGWITYVWSRKSVSEPTAPIGGPLSLQ